MHSNTLAKHVFKNAYKCNTSDALKCAIQMVLCLEDEIVLRHILFSFNFTNHKEGKTKNLLNDS